MRIRKLCPGAFGANCYLLLSRDGQAAVVDPSPNADHILQALSEEGARAAVILLTHGHFDHILSLDTLRRESGIAARIHEGDLFMPSDARRNAFELFFGRPRTWQMPDGTFAEGEVLPIGCESVTVLHTPGHTPGSVCFSLNGGQDLLTGDTLFDGSYGRFDLPGGDGQILSRSLHRLAALPQDTLIYPGHGDSARLGDVLNAIGIISESKGTNNHGF